MVKHIAIGVEGLGFDFQVGQIKHCHQQLATADTFLQSGDIQALTYRDSQKKEYRHMDYKRVARKIFDKSYRKNAMNVHTVSSIYRKVC